MLLFQEMYIIWIKFEGGLNKLSLNKFTKVSYGEIFWSIIRAFLIIGLCFIILYPLFTKFSISFMTAQDIFDVSVRFIPRNITFENYSIAYEWMNYPRVLFNTLSLVLTLSLFQLFSCTFVGYGFARYSFKGRELIFGLVILTLVVPPQLLMIPLFLNFRFFRLFGIFGESGINLLGTYWPFILTSLTAMGLRNGLYIYIMRQHFRGMPDTLEEAAYVDGAGPYRTFFKIMLPGAIPVLIVVFLFSFVWQWNDTFYLRLYLRDAEGFLSYALRTFPQTYLQDAGVGGGGVIPQEYTAVLENAGMVLFILPLLLLFSSLQRYFIESVQRTGIVG